jgi:hypothetical protein
VLLTATLGSVTFGHRITLAGVGPARVGGSVRDVSDAVGESLVEVGDVRSGSDSCHHMRFGSVPSLLFMVEDNRVVRVETKDRRFRTASGIRIGDSEKKVRQVYGKRLEISAHKYDDHGHYFIVRSVDRRRALVMETDGKTVVYIRAGLVPAAEYVEGCL